MQHKDPEELYALCHIFSVKFNCLLRPYKNTPQGHRARINTWVHQLWTEHPHTSRLLRQENVQGLDDTVWRGVIQRLLQGGSESLWEVPVDRSRK